MKRRSKTCREEALLDYLEGDLTASEARAVEVHLAECAACRQRLETLNSALKLVDGASHPPRNALYASRFLHKVRQAVQARHARFRGWRWRAGLVGSLGLAITLAWLFAGKRAGPGSQAVVGEPTPPREELILYIEEYLLETATTDELLREMQAVEMQELVVLIEE